MSTLFQDIKTKNWQISTVGVGYVAEGLSDIRQCVDIILRTVKGSDPLRPDFGCDIFQYADKPLTYAIPNIIRAMIEAIEVWETRVSIRAIRYEIQTNKEVGQVKFFVTCALTDDELIDLVLLYMNGGFVAVPPVDTGSLTLFALFPPNPNGKRYRISFVGDDSSVLPATPINGFATIEALYAWVVSNWSGYGSWQLGSDRITVFIPNGKFTTGSLTMSLVGTLKFAAPVPNASIGEDYAISFSPDGIAATPAPPASFVSIGEMLAWVQSNWGQYGTWAIEGNPYGPGDFDIQDFDPQDFFIGTPATYLLVLFTSVVNNCSIEVSIV